MGLKLRRKSVYAATVVAMLALVGGLAVASIVNTFVITSTQGQNSGTFGTSAANTLFHNGGSISLQPAAVGGSCSHTGTAGTPDAVAAAASTSVYIVGADPTTANCGTATEYYEEIAFASVTWAGGSDTFAVYTTAGTSSVEWFTVSGSYSGALSLDLFVSDGPNTATPLSITSIDIVVTGS